MTDLQQGRSRKMRKLTEIKQELSSSEENEGAFDKSVTSPNHVNSQQSSIKREKSCTSQAEDGVHLKKMTASLTCQVKTEPQSEGEEGSSEFESGSWDYRASYVIKREIIEVHAEDHPMMDDEQNHKKTTKDEDSGTETNHFKKSENDNCSLNFPDNYIDKQNNMFCRKTSLTQAKTLRQTKKSHKCSVCAKAFQSSQACLQHMWNTHTGENPYTCEVCGKRLKYLSRLQAHKTVHSDERPFSCDFCGKAFKSKSSLQHHKGSCHSDERPYACVLCDKAFKCKRHLQRHKGSCHSDERPYSCDLCEMMFKQKGHLDRHKTIIHSDERRPYSCDMCEKAFKQKAHLNIHKRIVHSDERPYSCDVCKKSFKVNHVLRKHKVLCHSDERPYSCDVCKKSFKLNHVLRMHKVLCHSNERPYSCDVCKKMFKRKADLYKHKRKVHSDEKA